MTTEYVFNWNGDGSIEELADYLKSILNEDFSIKDAKNEFFSYSE